MRQHAWRQVAIAGLAFVLLGMTTRLVAANRVSASVAAELQESRRWLAGTVIVVDPGHGGDDPGAVVGSTEEKHIVLAISKMLAQMLEEQGARVVLTRTEDVDLGGRIREELGRRVAMVEKHNANVYVSVHANKDGCNCWGAQAFYQKNGMPAGKELAAAIQNRLRVMTPTTRVPLAADYFVLRTSGVPAAMVEVGFLTNAKERGQLQEPAYQKTVATAIALGLADYFRQQVPQAKADGSIGQ